jgi:hypothetical protein
MRRSRNLLGLTVTLAVVLAAACDRADPTAPASSDALALKSGGGNRVKKLSAGLCSPGPGFTIAGSNPYFPLTPVGKQAILTGEDEGQAVRLQVTILDRTKVIEGVTTRVIEEREWVDNELFEVTWNYFAQASDGSACYFGEDVDIYEATGISHEGAWCAGAGDNAPGVFMPADPEPGTKFQMEIAPEVAEDEGTIVGIGPVEVPFGRFTETLRIREFNPLDGGKDFKIYAAGTGIIVDGPLTLDDLRQTSGAPEQPIPTDQVCGSAPG